MVISTDKNLSGANALMSVGNVTLGDAYDNFVMSVGNAKLTMTGLQDLLDDKTVMSYEV